MVTNAIWLEHPNEEFLTQDMETIVGSMVLCGVKDVFVQVGNWHSDGSTPVSINQWWSSSDIQNTVNALHTYSGNTIKAHAWMIWSGVAVDGGGTVDLTNATTRASAVNQAVAYTASFNFDGFNDDLYEGYIGDDGDYVAYANALGSAVKAAGYMVSCDLAALYATDMAGLYGSITTMDYICPMFYDDEAWYIAWLTDLFPLALSSSSCNVLAGLCVPEGTRTVSLYDQLDFIGVESSTKFMGVAAWSLVWLGSENMWTSLQNWYGSYSTASKYIYFEAYYQPEAIPLTSVVGTFVKTGGGTYTVAHGHTISLSQGTYVLTVAGTASP